MYIRTQDGKHLRCLLWLALWEEDDDCIDSVSEAASDLIENVGPMFYHSLSYNAHMCSVCLHFIILY